MVCSQVYSQHPSHCVFSNVQQHRSWAPSNAEVHCQEPETSEDNWLGNTTHDDGHVRSSKGYVCAGYANTTSPFKSSWIQRLIPSHNTRMEQPQPLDKLNRENHGIDGVQTNWKLNADYLTTLGNQPVYENSRRSKQEFFSSRQTYVGTNTLGCVRNGVNMAATSMPFEASDARPPEIQVSPKPLPVVESLLPGCSNKVPGNVTSTETIMPHILSRCTGFVNPMKQTVHYSANEKSRVSCSSIEGVNSRGAVCAAGDFLALKSLQMGKRCIDPSQPFSEFPFNSIDAVTRSNMDAMSGGKDMRTCASVRTHMNLMQKEDPFIALRAESGYPEIHDDWATSIARSRSVENRLLDGSSMPCRTDGIESLQERFSQANVLTSKMDERSPLGCSMDQLTRSRTISKRNCWNPKDCHSYAHDGSEALYAREGSFDGGWWRILNREKDGPHGANVATEKAGISSSHHMIEQELGSSHGSHEEQGGTSRSFSFHFEHQLASELDHGKVVARKGQWPFGPSALSSEDLIPPRWPEDNRARGLPEATRPALSLDNSSTFQETGVRDAGAAHNGRSRCSPFFGTENFNESASCRISDNPDVSPYKAACIDMRGMFIGDMNTKALPGSTFDQAQREKARSLLGGHKLSGVEPNLMIEGIERKELMFSLPARTVSINNWKAFEPSIRSSTHTCPPKGTRLIHADGNCVGVPNWKALYPSIRSSTHTCPPEGARLNHADDNLSFSRCSIGSCSKTDANLRIKDPSTSVDARSRSTTQEKPAALRPCGAPDYRESEGKEALGWEGPVKQNIWLRRWRSGRVQGVAMPEGRVLAGMTRARNYFEDYSKSQGSKESSYQFDLRPAKRICYEKRSGLQPELRNAISKNGENGVVSHFMKRFFTPSAAAMAIMGTTARKVHATQPQRRGLFGVWAWAWNDLVRKTPATQPELCKEFSTRPKSDKEFLHGAAKAPPTSVDL